MNELTTLTTAIGISLLLSSATVLAIHAPLRQLLEAVCPLQITATFWTRAAVTVFYLLPLCVVLAFGMPDLTFPENASASDVARRALAASSFALVAIVVATGLRLSSVRPASKYDYPPADR